jgi:hypothetical protein
LALSENHRCYTHRENSRRVRILQQITVIRPQNGLNGEFLVSGKCENGENFEFHFKNSPLEGRNDRYFFLFEISIKFNTFPAKKPTKTQKICTGNSKNCERFQRKEKMTFGPKSIR